jgi:Reverse transcriptase (RNA-dependent DNA polymerase)
MNKILNRLNIIDTQITNSMLHAERKKCSKKYNAPYSPKLYQSHLHVSYWNIRIKSARQHIDSTPRLNEILGEMDQEGQTTIRTYNLTLSKAMDNALEQHKTLLAKAPELRDLYIQRLIEDASERTGEPPTTLKSLIHREQSRSDFALLRIIFNGKNGKGITHIEVPTEDGKYTTIMDPVIIQQLLINRNIKHFGQAADTPFASSLAKLFGYTGRNKTALELIIEQKIPIELPNNPKYVKYLLDKLSDGNHLKQISNEISFEEFCSGLNKWRERTTTSPSGRHLGHYKILLRLPVYNDSLYRVNLSTKILHLYYQIAISTTQIGQPIDRWTNVTTCMIEKVKNMPRVDKLRVIHLFEADYNLLLKIMWARRAVWNANDTNSLNEGQAGSRPGKKAIDVVIRKENKYLYSRLTKTILGTIDHDAKSCFDRIICNLAMIVSLYFGIPKSFCELQGNTLLKTKFKLRTALGDSTETYTHTETTPIHGTGQGSCSSPALWLFTSSLLMDTLEQIAKGMEIYDVDGSIKIRELIEGFVDDASNVSNIDFTSNCIKTIFNKLEAEGTAWAGLLAAAGGKLELSKCFFYILSWKWDKKGNGIPQTISEQHNGLTIDLDRDNKTNILLEQKEVWNSHKTLGVYKCIDGNESDQINYLTTKSNQLGYLAIHGQMNRRQGTLAYNTTYIPSIL